MQCQICGNDFTGSAKKCPFCGAEQQGTRQEVAGYVRLHRTVNLKQGMPLVEPALKRLKSEIQQAKSERTVVLTVIHGYGSSGKGGAIREECRKTLDYMASKGEIHGFVPGEDFNKKNGFVKSLLNRYPGLSQNNNLGRGNAGVTIVVV